MMELSEVVVLELEDEVVAVAEEEEEVLRKWLPSGPPPTRWAKGEVFEVRRLRTSEGSLLEREDSLRAAPPPPIRWCSCWCMPSTAIECCLLGLSTDLGCCAVR